ncbi:hypothetical protein H7992_14360 [Sporosarcina sp. resist]|uniref:hypothetical protein n=1 Tax=Sporosarcina sp. resist TaxID=2762563 RepID=UPI00164CE151|nr:hypothetical protein [Sporosarcina sp. resist]QNK86442.1 hypothetical protein H7992_14360 [Sporosarcina sp. resist]
MEWKKDIENKIKQRVFLDAFKTDADVLEYLFNYFNGFFELQDEINFLKVTQKDDAVSIKVFDDELIAEVTRENIKFSCTKNDYLFLGFLFRDRGMKMHISETQKHEPFSEKVLERFMEISFNPNVVIEK